MVQTIPPEIYSALLNVAQKPLVIRNALWFKGRNKETGALETIGIWTGSVAAGLSVKRPDTGEIVTRTFQPNVGAMKIPAIPRSLKFEDRRIRVTFSRLDPAVLNAVLVYDIKGEPVEIYRMYFDRDTGAQIGPGLCRFDGFARTARIKRAKVGGTGEVMIELVGHTASLRPSWEKLSDEFFRRRRAGDHSGQYLNKTPKLAWGQELIVHEKKKQPRQRFFK